MKISKSSARMLIAALVLSAVSFVVGQASHNKMKPMTDDIRHTSGENGKWVKGCDNPPDSCNWGVGNVGPKFTYHWVN